MSDFAILAHELRRVRQNPPTTVSDAMAVYAKALDRARRGNVEPDLVLLIGEVLWVAIRPTKEPAPELIGEQLDELWKLIPGEPPEPAPTPSEAAYDAMMEAKANHRFMVMRATTKRDVRFSTWNGNHPPEQNTTYETRPAGFRCLVVMSSRLGDVGIRDYDLDKLTHGYNARVDFEWLEKWELAGYIGEGTTDQGGGA